MSKTNTGATSFDALLADITATGEDLTKAIAASDDGQIAAAAAEGEGDGEGDEDKDTDKDGEKLTKSLTVIGEDGEQSQAVDATDLLKSLMARVETGEVKTGEVLGAFMGLVKQQGELIKSLAGEVRALGSQGRGRRSVLTVHDKPGATEDLTKSLAAGAAEGDGEKPVGLNGQEFLAKALAAAKDGRIGYSDASLCETYINRGAQPPAEIVRAVLGEAAAV